MNYNRITQFLDGLFPGKEATESPPPKTPSHYIPQSIPDIGQVRGQLLAKQAMLIAAAGRHNLLMVGPPGEGKSFLASTLPGFLPPLTTYQLACLKSLYGAVSQPAPSTSPYRAIGPTITLASLIGGGRGEPIPGELALAHNGVLFIDELPQFPKPLIDSLRQPLEDRWYTVSRNGNTKVYQADVQLLAAMNPCPCGYQGVTSLRFDPLSGNQATEMPLCRCSDYEVKRYQSKVSGPILDRIDLVVRLDPLSSQERYSPPIHNQSLLFKSKVLQARLAQLKRQKKLNYRLGTAEVFTPENPLCFTPPALLYFQAETDKPRYSTRKTVRLARIARTIADIAGNHGVSLSDVHCAVSFVDQTIQGE